MSTTYFLPDESGSTKRPELIGVLGVLGFINTGFFLLVYAMGMLAFSAVGTVPVEEFQDQMRSQLVGVIGEEQVDMALEVTALLHANGGLLMAIFLGRTILRLIGIILLWQGRRNGFYVYATAQMAGIFAPHVVLPWAFLGFFGPLMAIGMTALYGSQLKRLG